MAVYTDTPLVDGLPGGGLTLSAGRLLNDLTQGLVTAAPGAAEAIWWSIVGAGGRLDIATGGGIKTRFAYYVADGAGGLRQSDKVVTPAWQPGNVAGPSGTGSILDSAGGGVATVNTAKLAMVARFGLAKGADIVAASSLALGTDGNIFKVTGNTNVDHIDDTHPGPIGLWFTGTPTLNHNTAAPPANRKALKLTGGANLVIGANDVVWFFQDGACWRQMAPLVNSGA